jgi:hypothetical protein
LGVLPVPVISRPVPDSGKDSRTIDFARGGKIVPGRIFPTVPRTRQFLPGAAEFAGRTRQIPPL